MFKTPPVIALDFSGDVIVSLSVELQKNKQGSYVNITKITTYTDNDHLLSELPQLKYSVLVVVPQNQDLLSFATPPLDDFNWSDEVRRRALDPQTHSMNFVHLPKSALLCAVSNTVIDQLKDIKNVTIVPDSLAQIYAYYRSYPDYQTEVSALLHFSQTHAQLVVLKEKTLVWTGSVEFPANSDLSLRYKQIPSLIQVSQQDLDKNFSITTYNRLVLSGECIDKDLYELKQFTSYIELLDPFRTGLYSSEQLSNEEKYFADAHKLAILLSSATMTLENIGINLNNHDENLNLINELNVNVNLQIKENLATKVTNNLTQLARRSVPMLENQKRLVMVGIFLCVLLTGYRIYDYNSNVANLESEIISEQKKFKALEIVKNSHDEYQSRLAAIQARVKFINDTQTKQLRVFTTLNQLNSRLPKLVNFSDLRIVGTSVEGAGWSTNDNLVQNYMNDINTSTVFSEVTPTFQNPEAQKVTFTFKTNYTGSVEAAPLPSTLKQLETNKTQVEEKIQTKNN